MLDTVSKSVMRLIKLLQKRIHKNKTLLCLVARKIRLLQNFFKSLGTFKIDQSKELYM